MVQPSISIKPSPQSQEIPRIHPCLAMTAPTFPVGYHSLHPDASMNFQMNRWFGWVGEPGMLEEMRAVAPRIATYSDWKREFLALAEHASRQSHVLRAGFHWRSAEFFMQADDPERKIVRERFLAAVRSVSGPELGERHAVPYADGRISGFLPAYRFTALRAKCTIVFFGGFDIYIEELTTAFVYLRGVGYDAIAFDGPGQGGALDEAGLRMTAEWHKPVSAVLNHFQVERVALVGLKRRPLCPDGAMARPDSHAQERALDHRTIVCPQRERAKPLPSGQLWAGLGNNRQLVGRTVARKSTTLVP